MFTYKEGDFWSASQVEKILGGFNFAGRLGLVVPAEKGQYKNRFVGWWTSPQGMFCLSLPKVFPSHPSEELLGLLVSSLRKYYSLHKSVGYLMGGEVVDRKANIVTVFYELLDHLEHFGWHRENEWEETEDVQYADWARTAEEVVGVSLAGSITYPTTVGKKVSFTLGKLAPIQAQALIDIEKKARKVLRQSRMRYDGFLNEAREICYDVPKEHYPLAIVEEYLSCNRDHDRHLAYVLLKWLQPALHAEELACSGTTSFPHMWELMLKQCMLATSNSEDLLHKMVASQPVYLDYKGEPFLHSAPQNPDVLLKIEDDVFILDAKWYSLKNLPGTPDIVKQVFYQSSLKIPFKSNAFIVPLESGEVSYMGACELRYDGMRDDRFPRINIIGVPVKLMLESYVSKKYSEHLGCKILDIARSRS